MSDCSSPCSVTPAPDRSVFILFLNLTGGRFGDLPFFFVPPSWLGSSFELPDRFIGQAKLKRPGPTAPR